MSILQSNIDYLTSKVENNIKKEEVNFEYEQDTQQGIKHIAFSYSYQLVLSNSYYLIFIPTATAACIQFVCKFIR